MQFKISTTGTQDPIVFHDLGARSFSHPTVDYDLSSEFKLSEISESYDVQNCIDLGYITAKDENDNPVIDVESIGLHQHGNKSELDKITIGDHDVTSTGNPHNVTKADVDLGNVDNVQQIPMSQKGVSGGIASLDGGGKVPIGQLPTAIQGGIKVIGTWNANTNTPNLSGLSPSNGEAYIVSVAGNTNLNGETNWKVKDLAAYINSEWIKLDNTDDVISVANKTGAVTLDKNDVGLNNVPNLDTTNAVNNQHTHNNKSELDKITIGDHDVTSTGNPHNVKATDISDFDTEVTNNSTVADHESRISGLEGAGLGISWFNFLIAVTPSSPLHIMGNGANGFNPGYDIRLLELRVQFLSEHNSQSALRVRVFKYDAVAAVSREVLSASANGVSQGYATLNDLTPDTDHYNLDSSEGDTVYLIIDRSNGSSPNRVSEISINVKYQPIG